jgi:arylsulfatase
MHFRSRAFLIARMTIIAGAFTATAAAAQQSSVAPRPNILIIWGDDVGMWNTSVHHGGMTGGETPNIDRIADEGIPFMDHYAHAGCTAGRAAFIMGQQGAFTAPA